MFLFYKTSQKKLKYGNERFAESLGHRILSQEQAMNGMRVSQNTL